VSTNQEICFVIMPFSGTTDKHTDEYWKNHFDPFLKPLIEECNLEARRSKALRGDILRQIITDLVVSRVVVADLTDSNPNVYWELGVRQSFKHGTVTIAEVGTRLPFDVGGKGTLFYYPEDHLEMANFRKRFKEAIKDCLVNPDSPDSHVLETLSGRGTLFEIFRRDEALRRLDAVLSEYARNSETLDAVIKQARANQKDPKNRQFVTRRFRTAAVELLTTSRYLDEEQSFYNWAEVYLNGLLSINAQLSSWEYSPDSMEKWILEPKSLKARRTLYKKFEAIATAARKKLSERF
jgi:hypothetical protein